MVNNMQLNEAVSKRITELCKERCLTQYQLSLKSGVPQSTLSTIINCSFPSMKMRIIHEICEGFEITLKDFFDSPLFDRENLID
ncbi:MAG: helix-turn-helix transcriptional regulator [Acutalibacteraceae bacterium]|nr:helix-turn-helix transcriptional regulator [Acutalibacteraceae bacterium]